MVENVQTVQDEQRELKKEVRSVGTDVGLIKRAVGTIGVTSRTSVPTIVSQLTAVEDTVLRLEQQMLNASAQFPASVQDPDVLWKLTAVESTVTRPEQQISKTLAQPHTPVQGPLIMDMLSAIMSKIDQLERQPSSPPTSPTPSLAISSVHAQGTASTAPSSPVLSCSTIASQTTAPTTVAAPELSIAFGTGISTAPSTSSPPALSFAPIVAQSTEPLLVQQPKFALSTVQTSFECVPIDTKVSPKLFPHNVANTNRLQASQPNEEAIAKLTASHDEAVSKLTDGYESGMTMMRGMFADKNKSISAMINAIMASRSRQAGPAPMAPRTMSSRLTRASFQATLLGPSMA